MPWIGRLGGGYDEGTDGHARVVVEKSVAFVGLAGGGYRTIHLGEHTLGPEHSFWLAPTGKADPATAIHVDRVFMIGRP